MEINVTMAGETIAVMKPVGEINASNFMEIIDKAQELFNNPAGNLILDLSEVPGISSAGQVAIHKIALLYSGIDQDVDQGETPDFTHSSNARKRVKLLAPQPEVEKALEKAGFKLFFKTFMDLESAVQSF